MQSLAHSKGMLCILKEQPLPTAKMWLFMKLFISFMLLTSLQLNAKTYSQKVTLSMKNAPFEKVLSEISKQSGFKAVYEKGDIENANSVSISVINSDLDKVLLLVFKNQPLSYSIINGFIVVAPKTEKIENLSAFYTPPPPVEIGGKVMSEKGEPLPAATVTVKGSKTGVLTDNNGEFKINASKNDVLVVSLIGYDNKEVTVGSQSTINITLVQKITELDQVVVVGYGTQKKVDLTGSVATVGSDKLDSRPLVNLGDGLQGLIPNLNVNINSGQPGQGTTYNIRGLTTIAAGGNGVGTSASPLILIDGVARDPNLIDPNDVASVTVLKDAASAAIYGGRAAYGVILITTKTGKKGAPQLSYSGSYTTSRPTNLPEYVNSVDYIKLFNSAQRTGSLSGGYTSSDPLTVEDSIMANAYFNDPKNNPDVYVDPGNPSKYRYVGNTDWVKVLYPGWAPLQQHNLSLSGGEGKTNYVASMGYFRQDGLEKVANQVYQRYTPSLKINTDVNKWLTLNLNISLTHTDNNQGAATRINQGGSWIPGDLRPLQPVYHPDGNFSGQGSYTNPVAVLKESGRDIDHKNDFWSTARVIIKPVDHLTITSDFTWNSFTEFDKANLIPFNEYGVNGTFLDIFPWTNPSQVNENRQNNNYTALNAYATYENTFKSKHYFKALVGYNQEYQHYQLSNSLARSLIDPTLPAIGTNNDTKPTVGGTETEYALIGSFFRLNYIYDQRYLIEVNGRYDGTSRFQPSSRYAFSPSISAGWNIAKEPFMQDLGNTINELKLRASYGQLPNQLAPAGVISSAAQYPYIATLPTGTVGYLFNDQPGVTVGVPSLISPTFTWEKVQTKNLGLDYAFLKGKLNGSIDYFITDTKNLLVFGQQLPAVLGTSAPSVNSAALRTKGWELSINWKDHLLNEKLFYSLTLSLSDNSSMITSYSGNPTQSLSDYIPGQKLGNIYGYTTEGFYKTNAEAAAVDNSALAGYTWLAGDIKYADLNKDGKINYGANTLTNHGDLKLIGNSTPHYSFGLNLNLSYKGFDFAAFLQGVLKQDFNPAGSNVFNAFAGNEYNLPYKYAMDYWTENNTNAYFARPRFAGSGNEQAQTKYLQSAAYARVKQLTLGYSLPRLAVNKLKLQRVRFYITGANLFKFTSLFKGFDPELLNYQIYPINKSLSFGLQASL